MTFKEFAREHSLTITYSPTGKGRWSDSLEFHVLLYRGEKLIWSGLYTIGIGIVEMEAQKLAKCFAATRPSNYYRGLSEASKTMPDLITVDRVLESLQLDVSYSDIPFEDWASGLGYESDSRKAYQVWETCNDYRRTLRSGLGETLFETFLNVSDEND